MQFSLHNGISTPSLDHTNFGGGYPTARQVNDLFTDSLALESGLISVTLGLVGAFGMKNFVK